jgi:integrase/recombinase XerD
MKLSQIYEEFLEDFTFREATVKAYTLEIKKLISYFGDVSVDELTKRTLKRYFTVEISKYAPRTQRRSLAFLKSFTRYLLAYDYIDEDITLQIKVAQVNRDIRANHSIHHQVDVYELLDRIESLEDKAIVGIALLAGLRLREIEQLKWPDIHDTYIHVRDGKGNKDRFVVLSPTLQKILLVYNNLYFFDSQGHLFISSRGLRMSAKTISRRIKAYTNTNPHSCRVTFATNLLTNGCDIETLRANMGHASINTTQAYIDRTKLDAVQSAQQFIR